ncbi:metal-dependent hydrolase [Halorussus salilacus]|uniref:metal-dependent hydrolase n=1 Tax=Halorussus salilacus TaxID=2953750 RepID=UPI00209DB088|nr:metal-dependent hydrolase [Halorussus salilacus]USZ68060.1 metal-dependent hydrolase [Halorussus salilacus]
MMVGHAMVAFALATAAASRRWSPQRALSFGVVAAAFATVPDVDMAYAGVGLAQAGVGGVWELTSAFWGSSTLVHRAVTHSLVVGAVAAVAFAATASDRARVAAVPLGAALVGAAFVESGPLGAAIMGLFVLAGVGVAVVAAGTTDLGPRELLVAALVGLLSHPFGDVLTGEPPGFFYPFDLLAFDSRVVLLGDPTLNLLAVFGVELATIWVAGYVYLRANDERLLAHVDARAAVGAAYAIAALALPAPTMEVSYHFVFSILSVGIVGVAPQLHPSRSVLSAEWDETITWVLTGLGAVSIAALAYTGVYAFAA